MLHLECRSYTYPGARLAALQEIDLVVPHGGVVGVVGANESGKSSLCLVASGMAPGVVGGALDGRLEIDGETMSGRPVFEIAQRVGLGLANPVSQLSGQTLTVFEEVALGPMNLGLDAARTVERVEAALAAVRIEHLALQPATELSGGETQLVVIAGLLAMEPSHLILDEPTSELDPIGTRLVAEVLHELAHRGTALLIVEHRTDLLDGLCDRIVVMDSGRIVDEGPAETIFGQPGISDRGIEPPARFRLGRALEAAGGAVDPGSLRLALGGWPHP